MSTSSTINNSLATGFDLIGQQLSYQFLDVMKSIKSTSDVLSPSILSPSMTSSAGEEEESKNMDSGDESTITTTKSISIKAPATATIVKFKENVKTCVVIQPSVNFCAVCAEPTRAAVDEQTSSSPSEEEKEQCDSNSSVDAIAMSEYTLSCNCKLHFDCLNGYIRNQIGDRSQMNLCGIACPNGRSCEHYGTSSTSFDRSFDSEDIYTNDLLQTSLSPFSSAAAVVSPFFITVPDLRLMTSFNEGNEVGEFSALTEDEIDRFEQWLIEQKRGPAKVNAVDCDPYVLATTKPCPTCDFRSTHYQGHKCHHISPASGRNSRGGCPNCHKNYCYKCLCSAKDNLRDRGDSVVCKCGFWSSFCEPIRTAKTVEMYISYSNGIPCDSRCGCTICPDCRFGKPCGLCDGSCAVCTGHLNPGPSGLIPEGAAKWDPYGPVLQRKMRVVSKRDFLQACSDGNLELVSSTLRLESKYITAVDEEGNFPLILASQAGHLNICKLLLSIAPNLLVKRNFFGETSLYAAVENNHSDVVYWLLYNMQYSQAFFGFNIDMSSATLAVDNDGRSLFEVAIGTQNYEIIDRLQAFI